MKRITATTIGGSTPFDLLKRINTGDAVLYGMIDDSGLEYPMLMQHIVASIKETEEVAVYIGDKQYYSTIEVETTVMSPDTKNYIHEGTMIVRPSNNLTFNFKESSVSFNINLRTDLLQAKKDAEFILDLIDKKELTIFNTTVPIDTAKASLAFIEQLQGIIAAGEALEDAGCNILIPFKELTIEDKKQIDLLAGIRDGKISFNTDKKTFLYTWSFRGKLWPIIVDKTNDETKIIGYAFNTSVIFSLGSGDDEEDTGVLPENAYIVPNFLYFKPDLLANLYYYDYEAMYEQIDRSVYNADTADNLNELALNLISAYDLSNNVKLLELAEEILRRLIDVSPDAFHYRINIGQIEVRRDGELSRESREQITDFRTIVESRPNLNGSDQADISRVFSYCEAFLVKDIAKADSIYKELTETDRSGIDEWPIRTLHLKLAVK